MGCHQLTQTDQARIKMHQQTSDIRLKLYQFISKEPRPAFIELKLSTQTKAHKGKGNDVSTKKVGGDGGVIHTSDMSSEATLTFNRREKCKSQYGIMKQKGNMISFGNVLDTVNPDGGETKTIQRLITMEDSWMQPPLEKTRPFFSSSGTCSRERETYRMSAGVAYRASYGPDMLLVSDK